MAAYHVATWRTPRIGRPKPPPPTVQPLFAARDAAAADRAALRRRRRLAGAALVARYRRARAERARLARRGLAAWAAGQAYSAWQYDDAVTYARGLCDITGFDKIQAAADAWADL